MTGGSRISGFIFLGPPGAGKGTQADIAAKKFGLVKIATGDILREAVRNGTELGKLAEKYMKRGELVPDDLMLSLVRETLKKIKTGFILDGFPRTVLQAEGLEKILEEENAELRRVIFIDVPDEVIIERLSNRRVCPQCGAVYNLLTNPPKRDEICDNCGSKLETRADDRPETIKRRLEVYRKKTEALVKYYTDRGMLVKIDGDGDLEKVSERILKVMT